VTKELPSPLMTRLEEGTRGEGNYLGAKEVFFGPFFIIIIIE